MEIISSTDCELLSDKARSNIRKRQHFNLHNSFQDPCQRLLNAIEPDSYIRPHRHFTEPRDEMLVAIKGIFAVIFFEEKGAIQNIFILGSQHEREIINYAIFIPFDQWHTVISLELGSVLLEVKEGPFDPDQPKDMANWAPEENTISASSYI